MGTFELIWQRIGVGGVTPAGEGRLRDVVQKAAERMEVEGRTEPADIEQAAANAQLLLARAGAVAKRHRGAPRVDETEIGIAIAGLCPGFWPFC